jgi:hypothetical protein
VKLRIKDHGVEKRGGRLLRRRKKCRVEGGKGE